MYGNLKKHKLLGVLSNQYRLAVSNESDIIGVSFDEISKKMECDKNEFLAIYIQLKSEDEADRYDTANIDGLFMTDKGYSAFSNKKYLLENERIIFDKIKNWVQTIIPILSLIITIAVIYINNKSSGTTKKEMDKLSNRIDSIEKKQPSIIVIKK